MNLVKSNLKGSVAIPDILIEYPYSELVIYPYIAFIHELAMNYVIDFYYFYFHIKCH